jgi:hypothetical protein
VWQCIISLALIGVAILAFSCLFFFSLETYNEFISFIDVSMNLSDLSVVPFITYSNADILKRTILNDNKGKVGVYR